MSEHNNCNWCGYKLIDGQTEPSLCSGCYRRYLVGLTEGADNEQVEKAEEEHDETRM